MRNRYYIKRNVQDNKTTKKNYYGYRDSVNFIGEYNFNLDNKLLYGLDHEFDNNDDLHVEDPHRKEDMSPYNSLRPFFDEIVKKVENKDDLDECVDTLEKMSFHLTSKRFSSRKINESEMLFLGEENGPCRQQKRHKYIFERWTYSNGRC